jgi:DNA-directed RNA polymerase specialized sigma24 family protein
VARHTTIDDGSITAAGLSRLLARLHADPDAAAYEYEGLRRVLIRFFDWRGAWPADECADETLDRLARRLQEGIQIEDVRGYARGIARMVLLERRRMPAPAPLDAMALVDAPHRADTGETLLHECLDGCLAELDSDARSLVLDYYQGERQAKIAHRRRLAAALGLSENALRSRVQRIRDRLEACVQSCAASRGERL